MFKKIKIPSILMRWLPLLIGALILFGSTALKSKGIFDKGETTLITKSSLIDTVDIAELSTAEFTYNGIAEVPDEKEDEIKCYVRYEAKVNASVNMQDIDFVIDDVNKTIKPELPEIKLVATLNDQEGFSFIPEKSDVDLQEIIDICNADVTKEATQTSAIYDSAEENLKDIIQALTYPIVKSEGYTLIWE